MIIHLNYEEDMIMARLESGENYLETILILQQRNGNDSQPWQRTGFCRNQRTESR